MVFCMFPSVSHMFSPLVGGFTNCYQFPSKNFHFLVFPMVFPMVFPSQVGLGNCVYLWSAATSRVTKLCDLGPEDSVTAVSWTQRGAHLAVGTSKGEAGGLGLI